MKIMDRLIFSRLALTRLALLTDPAALSSEVSSGHSTFSSSLNTEVRETEETATYFMA
jgi:hypothetical protein